MKLAWYGKREWLGGGLVALALAVVGSFVSTAGLRIFGWSIVGIAAVGWLALAAFFRVPKRTVPDDPALLLSPADGVVRDVEIVDDHGIGFFEGQPMVRVGIFLSVFDVHVNRAPCAMKVEFRNYRKGRFLDARNPRCARENESLVIAGTGEANGVTFPLAVRQISGAIARRIVCEPETGSFLGKGQIYGMIKFGSRTELYFPQNQGICIKVSIGERVRSGTSVIAQIKRNG